MDYSSTYIILGVSQLERDFFKEIVVITQEAENG